MVGHRLGAEQLAAVVAAATAAAAALSRIARNDVSALVALCCCCRSAVAWWKSIIIVQAAQWQAAESVQDHPVDGQLGGAALADPAGRLVAGGDVDGACGVLMRACLRACVRACVHERVSECFAFLLASSAIP